MSETADVVARAADVGIDTLPDAVIDKAKECILDQLGVQLIASGLDWNRMAYRAIKRQGGVPEATIVALGDKTSMANAAFVNATFGHGCELDDLGYFTHPGCNVVPTALAVGEAMGTSGKDILAAVVAGYEIENRIAMACGPGVAKRGFHDPYFVFGPVTVAGLLMGLSKDQLLHAFGLAGSYGGGLRQYAITGGEVKRIHPAIASQGGITAVQLAAEGFTAPPDILEGRSGFFHAFSEATDMSLLSWKWGEEYTILQNWFKAYPVCGAGHNVIEGVAKAQIDEVFDADLLEDLVVAGPLHWKDHIFSHVRPTDVTSAQFSLPFQLALILTGRTLDLHSVMDSELWTDDEVVDVAKRVRYEVNEDLSHAWGETKGFRKNHHANITVRLNDGRELDVESLVAKGMPENPMSRDELVSKFVNNALDAVPEDQAAQIVDLVLNLESLDDLSPLVEALVSPPGN